MGKVNATGLSCETLKDGALAINMTETLILVSQNRYQGLMHIEELYNAMHVDIDEKHHILEQERKLLKKTKFTAGGRSAKIKAEKCGITKEVD